MRILEWSGRLAYFFTNYKILFPGTFPYQDYGYNLKPVF